MGGHNLTSAATAAIGARGAGIVARVARIRAVEFPRVVGGTARTRGCHPIASSQLTGSGGRSHRGSAMVYRSKL